MPHWLKHKLRFLADSLEGDILTSEPDLLMYSVDASAYREKPLGIARPVTKQDIVKLVNFARDNGLSLIPRAAGTSLAGQVVGKGIVVDISRHMNKILEINEKEHWVRVEPGVILDELNLEVKKYGLFFGPETSTSNRCMVGGMVGNNSCGAHSLIYGSTRDHTLSLKAILSDGTEAEFGPVDRDLFEKKCEQQGMEGEIYRNIRKILGNEENRDEIRREFPDAAIKRRNTGYALDLIMETDPFTGNRQPFNFCTILAGSEGTLAFTTEVKLNLAPLPPREKLLVCAHFHTLEEALQGNLLALGHKPGAIELMDKFILDCTKNNISQQRNRFFIKGDPGAILIIEFARDSKIELEKIAEKLVRDFREHELGYHFPFLFDEEIPRVWALRKAGLGVLTNIPGDAKPVSVIEDTAVVPEKLPQYISDFKKLLDHHNLECVYHAHIATGELHLRPVLNLKDPEHVKLFRTIAEEVARLVKKYHGSLSGEHGDGRLRGEFIQLMIGEKNFGLLKQVKNAWDPQGIFNPGKIIDVPAMNTHLRYTPGQKTREIRTYFDFSREMGIIRAAEQCNGSGDCRKTEIIGGIMCPSYMATRDEKTTTRARANILREFLTQSTKPNPFNHKEIYDVMDLCLSCKGCTSECPSNVNISKYKAEFLQHYYDANGTPLRAKAIAYISHLNHFGAYLPGIYNYFVGKRVFSGMLKKILAFAPERSLPVLYKITLKSWAKKNPVNGDHPNGRVYLFADEFTDYNDTMIGIACIELLQHLGYEVVIPDHTYSGRTFLSKGLVRKAQKMAGKNVAKLHGIISSETPLIGIEPSALLSFRDEYPDLVEPGLRDRAKELARNCLMIDEFIEREAKAGKITADHFSEQPAVIKLHGHCHQKALTSTRATKAMLSLPRNYSVDEIPSGCCGMAGSFGYEKEHYDISMKVGELVLFPHIRQTPVETLIAAPGTSCRQQIKDGTGREALHPIQILLNALTGQ